MFSPAFIWARFDFMVFLLKSYVARGWHFTQMVSQRIDVTSCLLLVAGNTPPVSIRSLARFVCALGVAFVMPSVILRKGFWIPERLRNF